MIILIWAINTNYLHTISNIFFNSRLKVWDAGLNIKHENRTWFGISVCNITETLTGNSPVPRRLYCLPEYCLFYDKYSAFLLYTLLNIISRCRMLNTGKEVRFWTDTPLSCTHVSFTGSISWVFTENWKSLLGQLCFQCWHCKWNKTFSLLQLIFF